MKPLTIRPLTDAERTELHLGLRSPEAFTLRRCQDLLAAAEDGAAFVLPFATDLAWKHGVPKSARYKGRRVSVTVRAFEAGPEGLV